MASRSESSSERPSPSFPLALVRISSSTGTTKSKLARVALSNSIYWKLVKDADEGGPNSLMDFRREHSLIVDRLSDDATWETVEETVTARRDDRGSSFIVVRGKYRGPFRWVRLGGGVELVLKHRLEHEHDRWLTLLRAQVAPMSLLKLRFKELVRGNELSDAISKIELMLTGNHSSNSDPASVADSRSSAGPSSTPLSKKVEKFGSLANLNLHVSNVTGAIATAVKMGKESLSDNLRDLAGNAEVVANIAKDIGDVTRGTAGLSSLFQLVFLGAQLVHMFAEASRGQEKLPKCLAELNNLLKDVMVSVVTVLDSEVNMEGRLEDNVFDVLEGTLKTMSKIEQQLMRNMVRQAINASMVKEVEAEIEMLKHKVATVIHTALFAKPGSGTIPWEELPPRSKMSKYFVGRRDEISWLKKTLDQYGSAVISQFGGIGKTQLMSAFTSWAERDRNIFWVVAESSNQEPSTRNANDDARVIIGALAEIAEKLLRREIPAEQRKTNIVIHALKRGLASLNSRWLLCLDNADKTSDPEVSSILEAVSSIAASSDKNGWVLITTRQCHLTIWESMKPEQMLKLAPLSTKNSMILLWRLVKQILSENESDEEVWLKLKKFGDEEEKEFSSLKSLCEALGGLPLAFVQAAAYIRNRELSFSKYRQLYGKAQNKAKLEKLFPKAALLDPVKKEQRAIFTTWSMNVEELEPGAKQLLQIVSMLGNALISDSFMKSLIMRVEVEDEDDDEEDKYWSMLTDGLVNGYCLLQKEETEKGLFYDMHRLIRQFVLIEMKQDIRVWDATFAIAVTSTYSHLHDSFGTEFADPPKTLRHSHLRLVSHTSSIAHNTGPLPNIQEGSLHELEKIHKFTARVLENSWRDVEAEDVWERVLAILRYRDDGGIAIASVLSELGELLRRIGKLKKAADMHCQALQKKRECFGGEDNQLSIAKTLDHLGMVYERQGNLDIAVERFVESLSIKHEVYGHGAANQDIAGTINSLANVYHRQYNFDQARKMRDRCLETVKALYRDDSNHRYIATALMNLGLLYVEEDEFDDAVKMYEKSLKIRYVVHGTNANDPELARLLYNFGNVFVKQGKYDDALDMHSQCLEMREAVYGSGAIHPDIASSLNALGLSHVKMRNYDDAEDLFKKSLNMMKAIYERESSSIPSIAMVLNNTGNLYRLQGKLIEACELHRQGLEMRRSIYSRHPYHLDVAQSLLNLGITYMDRDMLDEAKERIDESVGMFNRIFDHIRDHAYVRGAERVRRQLNNKLIIRTLASADEEKLDEAGLLPRHGEFSVFIDGQTPLHLCASQDLPESAEILLMHGGFVDTLDFKGRTPLMVASEMHHIDMVKILTKNEANHAYRDDQGDTALHYAVSKSSSRLPMTIRQLCGSGACVDSTNYRGRTALHSLVLSEEQKDISNAAVVLLELRADINACDGNAMTPLMLASQHDKPKIAEILLERGALVDAVDSRSKTPLMFASEKHNVDMIKILSKHKADLSRGDACMNTALHYALEHSSPRLSKAIRLLCESDANVNASNDVGQNVLHILADSEELKDMSYIAKILLEHAAEVNARDKRQTTPLMYAAKKHYVNIIQVLIDHDADLELQEDQGLTALHYAFLGSSPALRMTIDLLYDSDVNFNATDNNGRTVLHMLADSEQFNDKSDIAKMLIERGANFDLSDKRLKTPLMYAAKKHDVDVMKVLIDKGADITRQQDIGLTAFHYVLLKSSHRLSIVIQLLCKSDANINASDNSGRTVLHMLVDFEQLGDMSDIAEYLLEKGAKVNARDIRRRTPLMYAAKQHFVNVIEVLLEKGADSRKRSNRGLTALHYAVQKSSHNLARTIQLLCDSDADINASDDNGQSVLHVLAGSEQVRDMSDIVEILLKRGAEVNARDKEQKTPLMYAAKKHCVKTMEVLINYEADVNLHQDCGLTALHYAFLHSSHGLAMTMKLLCDKRANINASDNTGQTVLHKLADSDKLKDVSDFAEVLLGRGAEVNARDKKLKTPLMYAAKKHYVNLLKVLIKKDADATLQDDSGGSGLYYATTNWGPGLEETIRILCGADSDVKARTSNGKTVVHNHGVLHNPDVIPVLVGFGAEINSRDEQGFTPLHEASYANFPQAVPVLVRCGASVNARDEYRQTPLFSAAEKGFTKVVKALLAPDVNADITIPNEDGVTPLQTATAQGHDEIVSLLTSDEPQDNE